MKFLTPCLISLSLLFYMASTTSVSLAAASSEAGDVSPGPRVTAVAVRLPYVFLGDGNCLTILNVSDLSHPKIVSRTRIPGRLSNQIIDVKVRGDYAFFSRINEPLFLANIADLQHPKFMSAGSAAAPRGKIALGADFLYFGDGDNLCIFDVSNPESIKQLSQAGGSLVESVMLSGSRIYGTVTGHLGTFLKIFDVSDPRHPKLLFPLDGGRRIRPLCVKNNGMYAVDDDALLVYDVTNPSASRVIGKYSPAASGFWDAINMVISGNRAFVVEGQYGIEALNISDPTKIRSLCKYRPVGGKGIYRDVELSSSTLFAAAGVDGLKILDVSKKTTFTLISEYKPFLPRTGE